MSPMQKLVYQTVLENKQSVFFTGCAGTGKSFLLHQIIKALPPMGTFVTASTGMAAVNVKGTTLHSFAGIGLGHGAIGELIGR